MTASPDLEATYVINKSSVEAKFAQRLAANEKKIRDRTVKKLRQYLIARSAQADGGFKRDEMIRIWKGLFYCMWMSDKPLIQEELANSMADILPKLQNIKTSMMYFETFLSTIHREWKGIDRLRMDKFLLLTRFMLSSVFKCAKNHNWDNGVIDWLVGILKDGPICTIQPGPSVSTGPPLGIRYHFADVYLDELTAVGHDSLTEDKVLKLLQPCCRLICNTPVKNLRDKFLDGVFQVLIDQSEPALKLVEEVTDEVERPEKQLNVNYGKLADLLFEFANKTETMARNRKRVYKLVQILRGISEGRLPLDDLPVLLPDNEEDTPEIREEDLLNKLSKQWIDEYKERKQKKKDYNRAKKSRAINDDADDGYFGETNNNDDSNNNHAEPKTANHKKKKNEVIEERETEELLENNCEGDGTLAIKKKKKKKAKKVEAKSVDNAENKSEPAVTSSKPEAEGKSKLSKKKKKSLKNAESVTEPVQEVPKNIEGKTLSKKKSKSEKKRELLNKLSATNGISEKKEDSMIEVNGVVLGSNLEEEDINMESCETEMETTMTELISPNKNEIDKQTETNKNNLIDNRTNDEDILGNEIYESKKIGTKSKTPVKSRKSKRKILETSLTESNLTSSTQIESKIENENKTSEEKVKTPKSLKKKKIKEQEKNNIPSEDEICNISSAKKSFAEFKKTPPPSSAFIKVAMEKVNKSQGKQTPKPSAKKRKATAKDLDGIGSGSPKRVSFEMSKIQVQSFRKNQKPSAVSPSPLSIPFDPNKTPDFGLLKVTTRSAAKKKSRAKAEDFFFDN